MEERGKYLTNKERSNMDKEQESKKTSGFVRGVVIGSKSDGFIKPTPEQVAWVFSHVRKLFEEGFSFRKLIYDHMGFSPSDYSILERDGQALSNMAVDFRDIIKNLNVALAAMSIQSGYSWRSGDTTYFRVRVPVDLIMGIEKELAKMEVENDEASGDLIIRGALTTDKDFDDFSW